MSSTIRSEIEIDTSPVLPGRCPAGGVSFPVAEPDGSGTAPPADNASHVAPLASTSGSATVCSARLLLGALVALGLEAVTLIALLAAWAVWWR